MNAHHFFGLAHNDFNGFAYQVPIFVVTDNRPDNVAKGENSKLRFTFVTDGIAHAVKMARYKYFSDEAVVTESRHIH